MFVTPRSTVINISKTRVNAVKFGGITSSMRYGTVVSRARTLGAVDVAARHRGLRAFSGRPPQQFNHVKDEAEKSVRSWETRFGGQSSNFPDFIEKWTPDVFKKFGAGMTVASAAVLLIEGPTSWQAWFMVALTGSYWYIGINDMRQQRHAIRRNFPVLGNMRYVFETLRPEIRQYFVEGDYESAPYSREARSIVYRRSKNMNDTLPLGTRRDTYHEGYEWATHSMWPKTVAPEDERVLIGGPDCKQPYSASLLNISAMSFGALSSNAIKALNTGAALGNFYHNTGEGGISRFHLEPGGDITWNVGTGYFGCRNEDGTFNAEMFKDTAARPQVKMVELKLSQGAKPAHGGILPGSKLTPDIAFARGIDLATWGTKDVNSPPRHSAFAGPHQMMEFIANLRELTGGKPVGFKLCIGSPVEFAALVHAMVDTGITPDFITVDGGEGGTGAAPPEFSNSVGTPLVDGLTFVHGMLRGAGLRDRVRLIASGKVLSGFSMVRNMSIGADLCNSARAMMFALGCVQALKCNTNHCPSGVATQDPRLMAGLVPEDKARRVARYHANTVHTALEIVGALGLESPSDLRPFHIMRRTDNGHAHSYAELFPKVERESLLTGEADHFLQSCWDRAASFKSSKMPFERGQLL